MDTLKPLHDHQHEAEYDAAVLIDDHNRARRVALFLAHHRVLRGIVLAASSPALAVAAAWWAVREAGRVIDRTHEIAGEDGTICPPCARHDVRALKADEFTVATFVGLCDLAELRGTDGGEW